MSEYDSIEAVLDFAIGEEEKAAKFYGDLARRVPDNHLKQILLGFAEEEMGHKEKLIAVKKGEWLTPTDEKIPNLKIAEYVVEVDHEGELGYSEALVLAMKRELAAFKMYTRLAEQTDNEEISATFLELAQEEAKHKLRFEMEYDDNVMKEN